MDELTKELDDLDELVYLSDIDTYELLYINSGALRQFGLDSREEIAGRKCYEVLQHLEAPCSFCTNSRLCQDKFYEWDFSNKVSGRQYLLKDKLIEYQGRLVRMEIALDITRIAAQERQIATLFDNEQIAMECARSLQDTEDEAPAVNRALATLGERLGGARTYIFEFHDELMDNTYEWCAPGTTAEIQNLQSIPLDVCHHWIAAFRQNKPYVITDLEEHKDTEPDEYNRLKPQGIHSLIVVPLFDHKELIGFLGIDNPPLGNGSNIVEILQLLAFFIQVVLVRIKANKHLQELTYLDEMTGVKNRNAYIHIVESLNARIHLSNSQGKGLGIGAVFVDANGLKELNDTAGHEAGDQLLIRIAKKLMRVFLASEIFRTGGDEFVILCDNMDEETFFSRTDQLKQVLSAPDNIDNDAAVGICWSDSDVYLEEIINQAEADMYEDKKQYYANHSYSGQQNMLHYVSYNTCTNLLIKDTDVTSVASELLHIIMEQWNDEKIELLLDDDFALFEEEYKRVYQRNQALFYLKEQQFKNAGQKIRDLQFIRKRIIRGISLLSCFGQLDWKAEGGKNCSIPFESTLVFIQRKGRIKCVYMHGTNAFFHRRYEMESAQGREDVFLNMITRMNERRSPASMPSGKALQDVYGIMTDAFSVWAEKYSNVYFVDIQNDSYVGLKVEGKFLPLVGAAGNYTCINMDYAEQYMDDMNKFKYLDFTSRKNLLDNLEKKNTSLSMTFSVTKDAEDPYREIEIDIWLGRVSDISASLFAFRNITDRPHAQMIVEKDHLTGLLSYEKFRLEGQKLIDHGTGEWAMISTDIQNFKYVNEALGYHEGDDILKMLASNLLLLSGNGTLHTRITADRFLTMIAWDTERGQLIEKISDNTRRFNTTRKQINEDIKIVLRTGVYFLENGCSGIDTAIDRANLTRQSIGQSFDSEIRIYREDIIKKDSIKNEILATMEKTMENGDFQVWFQPKVNLKTGKLCGAEALIRWMRGSSVCFYPDDFIPIFENNGFITSLDFYVLETTCQNIASWIKDGYANPVRISVNLSVIDISQGGIVEALTEIVDRYGIDHSILEFELTETAYFKNSSVTTQVMEQLKNEGFITSVDDFGSGYSVMNMLINMPASIVKIDREFMLNSVKTQKGRAFLQKIIGMIHELDYQVLCEGIETQEQYDMLSDMGCDEGQGYLFSKPVPAEEFFKNYVKQ